jgi:hypothetical protein
VVLRVADIAEKGIWPNKAAEAGGVGVPGLVAISAARSRSLKLPVPGVVSGCERAAFDRGVVGGGRPLLLLLFARGRRGVAPVLPLFDMLPRLLNGLISSSSLTSAYSSLSSRPITSPYPSA